MVFVFFKQKTAYEMRISDWSSDVCSSDLRLLVASGRPAYVLDGDNLRLGLNGDLGFSEEDRTENVRRVAHVARLMADAGVVVLVPLISPYRSGRDEARAIHAEARLPFVEVYVDTPLELCEQRDPKGLYKLARAGQIQHFTSLDSPYEPPPNPELTLRPDDGTPEARSEEHTSELP